MTANEDAETVSAGGERGAGLAGEDKQLIDLVTAALVDPNLHTDVRMRLHREITEILRSTRAHPSPPSRREAHRHAPEADGDQLPPHDQLPRLVTAVLVDPNVPTDVRMRLQREISAMLQTWARPVGGGSRPE